jgi:two-component system, NtrC family, sensor kinase
MEGFEVMTASNGPDGLIKAKSRVPDVLICDYMMPLMNGVEVCRAIRADEQFRDVAIILWSAARNIAADGLVDLMVEKPVQIEGFLRDIRRSLELRKGRSGPHSEEN